jgi:SAM-dependent methyltransferase
MAFQDHFSAQAGDYARFRPRYPPVLFEWLAAIAPGRALAWDCGTGSGQAAVALAARFARVLASDPSRAQIAHAAPHPRVRYVVGAAEDPPAEAQGADLVTCAQALHWFDHARFYPALARTLRPGGVFAAWGYGLMHISPAVDVVVLDYYTDIVGPYWPPDRAHIERRYATLPFPLAELSVPEFAMTAEWGVAELLGYLDTWSATRRALAAEGRHPLEKIRTRLAEAWAAAPTRTVTWPLFVRAGRAEG